MSRHQLDEDPLSAADHKRHQEALGVARFISDTVGYQIALATSELAARASDRCMRHMQVLKHLGRYLKGNPNKGVTYFKTSRASLTHVEVWVDSDWASCPDNRYSRSGIAVTYAGDMLLLRSSKQHAHAMSSAEAEYISASLSAREIAWLLLLSRHWKIPLRPSPSPQLPFHLSPELWQPSAD